MSTETTPAQVSGTDELPNGFRKLPSISSVFRLHALFNNPSHNLNAVFDSVALATVADLSFQDNNVSQLPANFANNFSSLVKLNLSNNNLLEIGASLGALKSLQQLIVDTNRLRDLPSDLGELTNLKYLSVKGNRLAIVNESLGNLRDLEELNLSCNRIRSVSDSCGNLTRLQVLNLSRNEIQSVPKCVCDGLARLETLDLSYNYIINFDSPPSSNVLKHLYLNFNSRIKEFPNWLLTDQFSNLEVLVLDGTCFESFNLPASTDLPVLHLRKLSMEDCGLSDTPFERMSRCMANLEYLNVGNVTENRRGNGFWTMPAQGFKNPGILNEYNIQTVGLPAVPREVNTLRNLTKLNISENNISNLPEELCELQKLEFINASHNMLYALPEDIGKLHALEILFVESNRLSSLPDSVRNLTNLQFLDLYSNEFLEIPAQLEQIPQLRGLDLEGNMFTTNNLQIANIDYTEARNNLRSTSANLLLRCNDVRTEYEMNDTSMNSLSDYEDDDCNEDKKSLIDTKLSDAGNIENWDISDDSADEFDPTVEPRPYRLHSPFTVSSVFYYGNFCPADLHTHRIQDQLAAMNGYRRQEAPNIQDGQFDDA